MDKIENRIMNAASRQQELLNILAETDYASSALGQQDRYLLDLEYQAEQGKDRIAVLETKRAATQTDHEKYQNSVMKRFAYRATGQTEKFDARAAEQEKEYFKAMQEEHIAKKMLDSTLHTLEVIRAHRAELSEVVTQHDLAQKNLDAMYHSIFDGPSPGFSLEDDAERRVIRAVQSYHGLQNRVGCEKEVVKLLTAAQTKMAEVGRSLSKAHKSSQFDMFSSGILFDIMERNALGHAETEIAECSKLLQQAYRFSADVQPIQLGGIAGNHLMSDVLFDNPITDHMFHERIKESQEQQQQASASLDNQIEKAQQRLASLSETLSSAARELERSRVDLQREREAAFLSVIRACYEP